MRYIYRLVYICNDQNTQKVKDNTFLKNGAVQNSVEIFGSLLFDRQSVILQEKKERN